MTTFLERPESAERILNSEISMIECSSKLQKVGLRDKRLCRAIEILKADFEMRQIFLTLDDDQARYYILYKLKNHD
jgi:hypothetical protein